jgi:serine/threonine protein kinase/thioredoxin-like negative regulator of GroEL
MSVNLVVPANSDKTLLDADEAKALASEIIARTDQKERFDADAILEEHPGLAEYRSVVVDLAYEEFCRALDAGQPPDPQEFVRRFPDVAHSLLKVLEVHRYLDHHPDTFEPGSLDWPQAGEEVAGFTLVREIGRGGFSRVFLARERNLGDREVVVKICTHASEEAARLGQLEHPHIVPVHSVQLRLVSGFSVICMPYLSSATWADVIAELFAAGGARPRGVDVLPAVQRINQQHGFPARGQADRFATNRWPWRRGSYAEAILETGAELCEALEYAHRQGICHCDVKPSNVLLTTEGRSLLLDFNLSMQSAGTAAVVGGTLPYMAPEQLRVVLEADARSVPEIDHRTDLFALGVTMFQLLTGRLPFPTDDLPNDRIQSARQLLERQRDRGDLCDQLTAVASPEIARVIAGCMAFDPQNRPPSAADVGRRFRQELGAPARVRRWVRDHKSALAGGAAALVLLVAFCGIGLALRPASHVRQFERGVAYLEAGQFDAARGCFEHAYGSRSDFHQALALQGWADLKAAQQPGRDEAERSARLRSAHQAFDANWMRYPSAEAAASLAWCLLQIGNHNDARCCFDKALQLGLATPAVLNNLGYCLTKTKNLAEAAVRLEDAVRLDPTLQAARHNLAVVAWRLVLDERRECERARRQGDHDRAASHEARAAELLWSAMEHVEAALQSGPRSAELELVAANIYACLSASRPQDANPETEALKQESLEKALKSCQAAMKLHLPASRLKEPASLNPQLAQAPLFQELLTRPPASAVPGHITLTVDVFPDIRSQLIAVE